MVGRTLEAFWDQHVCVGAKEQLSFVESGDGPKNMEPPVSSSFGDWDLALGRAASHQI